MGAAQKTVLHPFHFTRDEINTQRGRVTCPRSGGGRTGPELGALSLTRTFSAPSRTSALCLVRPSCSSTHGSVCLYLHGFSFNV